MRFPCYENSRADSAGVLNVELIAHFLLDCFGVILGRS